MLSGSDKPPFLLILDGVTDPHNLGACLRTADAVGVQAVVVPKDKSASLSPTVRKVACGAAETVPLVRVTNLARFMRTIRDEGVWLIGTAGEASSTLYQADFTGPVALVMGAEGKGMRRLTREHCDLLINIPCLATWTVSMCRWPPAPAFTKPCVNGLHSISHAPRIRDPLFQGAVLYCLKSW